MKIYRGLPLFVKIIIGALIGVLVGEVFGKQADSIKIVSDLVLQSLRLLATPLIFLSLVHSLLSTDVKGKTAGRLMWLLMSNTVVAILIGLFVANTLAPGNHINLPIPAGHYNKKGFDPIVDLVGRLPKDLVNPFASNELIGIIVLGLAIGLALRALKGGEHADRIKGLIGFLKLGLDTTLKLLHWLFELVPFAVLAIVGHVVGTTGYQPLINMAWFVVSVVLALTLMCCFYFLRLRFSSRIRPIQFLKGAFDAFALAFSTASSAATLPVTYACATQKLGIREESASLGIMVGGTFNHDGTALYEAMAALFVAQTIDHHMTIAHQIVLVLMAIVASVGAAGIPEAGLVTMIAVFSALRLPIEYIPLLLPLDWFLDRCRTTVNVAGDLVSTCIVDNQKPPRIQDVQP